jgi:hypothetical protein
MGEPTSLLAARLWTRVSPDSALVRLDRRVRSIVDGGLRSDWFDVLVDAAFDGIRDDPRYRELNARLGL